MDRSKVRAAVSWFFIIATIVSVQITIYNRNSVKQSVDTASILQIQMTGKNFIGVKQLARQNPLLEKRLSQLKQGILSNQGHINHLSNIPILAEVSGKDAALKELERMAADPDNVLDAKNIPVFSKLYYDGSDSLDSEQVTTLEKYGWSGRLALSQDKPDSDPERRAVLNSALRMVMFLGLFSIAVIAVLVGGLILLIIAIVQGIKGNLRSHLNMPQKPGILLLETFAIYLVLSMVLPILFVIIVPGLRNGALLIAILAGFLPMLWPLLQGMEWSDYCKAFGWHRGKGFFHEVGAGIVGYITGLPLMAAAFIVVMILVKYSGYTPSHPTVFQLSRSPFYLFLLACVYAPFVEETLFRGALYGYLRRYSPWIVSGIISSFIFAIIHPQGWVAVPIIGVIGFNLSVIREWRGSTIASMTAHALNNSTAVLIVILLLS